MGKHGGSAPPETSPGGQNIALSTPALTELGCVLKGAQERASDTEEAPCPIDARSAPVSNGAVDEETALKNAQGNAPKQKDMQEAAALKTPKEQKDTKDIDSTDAEEKVEQLGLAIKRRAQGEAAAVARTKRRTYIWCV